MALVQAGLVVFFYFYAHGKGLLPVSDECCIKIRDTKGQNAISLVFPSIPN